MEEHPPRRAVYGSILDGDGGVLDEVVCTAFAAPHSFTGENSVEIACHGSLFIQQNLLRRLMECGCRMATAGEFTQRAFANGKMDLSQAEAVADLIASNSEASHRLAINQMRGGFSRELAKLRQNLLDFVSLVELELDFGEEEVEFADRQKMVTIVDGIKYKIKSLADSFKLGNTIKNGLPVAIVGETNVGKSTLLNWLLNEEKAIVSDVHGTTRDVVEDTVMVGGILFRFIDTAGIRETNDEVESLGIERTFRKMKEASVVLLTVDSSYVVSEIREFIGTYLPRIKDKQVAVVFNKTDIITAAKRAELEAIELPDGAERLFISAKQNQNKQELLDALLRFAQFDQQEERNVVVTNMRHYEALTNALAAIERVETGLGESLSGDLLSRDIRDCMHFLGEITGEITNDNVLHNIFSHFCIGK